MQLRMVPAQNISCQDSAEGFVASLGGGIEPKNREQSGGSLAILVQSIRWCMCYRCRRMCVFVRVGMFKLRQKGRMAVAATQGQQQR